MLESGQLERADWYLYIFLIFISIVLSVGTEIESEAGESYLCVETFYGNPLSLIFSPKIPTFNYLFNLIMSQERLVR